MFGIAKSVKSRVCDCTPELFNKAIDDPRTGRACAEIADALEMVKRGEMTREEFETKKAELKKQLPVLTPHATYTDGKRSNKSAVPSGLSIYDIDHINDPRGYYQHMVADRLGELGIVMAHVTPSNEGLRLLFAVPAGMSLAEAQKWMSEQLNDDNYDGSVKDLARCSFLVPRDYILYIDEEGLFAEREAKEVKSDGTLTEQLTKREDGLGKSETAPLLNREGKGESPQLDYNGIPYSEIIAKWWEMFNEGKEPVKSNRDVLTFELAVNLRHICGFDRELMDSIIPCYDEFPEAQKLKCIDSALGEKRTGMPNRLKQVLQALKSASGVRACGGTPSTPPPMPKRLPPLIKLLTKNVPDQYKPAVANAVFPALGVHLHGVKFRYLDNVEHEATFMNVLIGRQSVGKGSIKKPIEFIMEDIRQRDIPNRQREAEWKQKNPNARQKKDPRPTDICIQMLIDNLTDAVFNQRVVDANNNGERFIYTIVDEIDALKKVTSKGTTDEVGLLIRKAFDNSMAGQERWGADSVSGIAPLRWNFNASATPPNAKRFFYKMVNDGTMSRLDISTIIPTDDEEKIPVLGIYDHNFAAELKPYIDRLEAANGLIECPQAKRLAQQICLENYDTARLYESEAYRVLSYRANVIAWLKGMVLYVAHGYKWDKSMADFMRWTEQYNLWCKMLYFGQQLEKELREETEMQRKSGPQNMLELLPDEFSREQYCQIRLSQGKTGDGDSTLRTWMTRGHIVFDEATNFYCKTENYKQKFSK